MHRYIYVHVCFIPSVALIKHLTKLTCKIYYWLEQSYMIKADTIWIESSEIVWFYRQNINIYVTFRLYMFIHIDSVLKNVRSVTDFRIKRKKILGQSSIERKSNIMSIWNALMQWRKSSVITFVKISFLLRSITKYCNEYNVVNMKYFISV